MVFPFTKVSNSFLDDPSTPGYLSFGRSTPTTANWIRDGHLTWPKDRQPIFWQPTQLADHDPASLRISVSLRSTLTVGPFFTQLRWHMTSVFQSNVWYGEPSTHQLESQSDNNSPSIYRGITVPGAEAKHLVSVVPFNTPIILQTPAASVASFYRCWN